MRRLDIRRKMTRKPVRFPEISRKFMEIGNLGLILSQQVGKVGQQKLLK